MSTTIELGRAVISSSAHVQLWLTTLITVSPQQESANLQQLDRLDLLGFLLSGNAWVGRGNGMHMVLELTVQGEPLGPRELGELAENIVNAPAWSQLNLHPSLPVEDNTLPPNNGRLHINISHAHGEIDMEAKRYSRICSNVPFANVTPPEGVSNFALQSVRFSMEFIGTKGGVKPTRQKRPKQSGRKHSKYNMREGEKPSVKAISKYEPEDDDDPEIMLHDGPRKVYTMTDDEASPMQSAERRKRPLSVHDKTTPRASPEQSVRQKRPCTISNISMSTTERLSPALHELEKLVDSAIRLSVCNTPPKLATGMKIKASTFTGSLADLAPTLWRSGYFPALSQRAHFLPIISRSLDRAASAKAKSLSLQDKVARLSNESESDGPDRLRQGRVDKDDGKHAIKPVSARLWVHMQRNLSTKTATGPLDAFCASGMHTSSLADSDDILDSCPAQMDETKSLQTDSHSMSNVYDQGGFHIDPSTFSHKSGPLSVGVHLPAGRRSDIIHQEEEDFLLIPDGAVRSFMHSISTDDAFIGHRSDDPNEKIPTQYGHDMIQCLSEECVILNSVSDSNTGYLKDRKSTGSEDRASKEQDTLFNADGTSLYVFDR